MSDSAAWQAFCGRLFDQNQFAIKLGLDNMRRAFVLEGNPERCAPAIVVGGTNGKGTTCAFLASILQAHGLRVGLFTSPHLLELRERFRVDGLPVSREAVLGKGRRLLDRYGAADSDPCLTFFELTTLMAAQIFRDVAPDVVVWEVGLGGRLDAVNAIEPALTVVTNIDLDHQKWLGDDVASIAREKAGLHRKGVPLVVGPQTWAEASAALRFDDSIIVEADSGRDQDDRNRAENLATALVAARSFLGDEFQQAAADRGVRATSWPGRLERRAAHGRTFLLDAAHNPAGTGRLAEYLASHPPASAVIGAMADKDLPGMFAFLGRLGVPVRVVAIDSARAATLTELQHATGGADVIGRGRAGEVFDALPDDGLHAVFGSVYLLGEWFDWAGLGADDLVTFAEGG